MSNPKLPSTTHDIMPVITERWSARSFADKAISDNDMNALFEAASWSASSMNEQPWNYLYAHRGTAAFDKMVECLMPGNSPWAKNGSVLILSLAKRHFDRNGKPNRHAMYDVGAANNTLMLEATKRGMHGHQMGGFEMEKTLNQFNIDSDKFEIACFIVLGYLDDADKLDEPYLTREKAQRTRHSISEITKKLS